MFDILSSPGHESRYGLSIGGTLPVEAVIQQGDDLFVPTLQCLIRFGTGHARYGFDDRQKQIGRAARRDDVQKELLEGDGVAPARLYLPVEQNFVMPGKSGNQVYGALAVAGEQFGIVPGHVVQECHQRRCRSK